MSKRKTIYCIEDDADTRELLLEELDDAGFDVVGFADGTAALKTLAVRRADLIICDIDLPDLSGFDVLKSLAEPGPGRKAIPFIFLTAYGQRDNQILARRLGCDDYLVKPIDFELLLVTIHNQLSKGGGPESGPGGAASEVRLTEREREALGWAARGKSSADIAILVGIAERTVNFHIDNALRKLGVATRIQAAIKAIRLGLIEPP